MAQLRIRSVRVEHFRGVPDDVTVDFYDSTGAPQSVLLIGDNGSGKSTIVDAIEFALQGRVGRQPPAETSLSPELISLRGPARDAKVTVSLSDGTAADRRLERRPDGQLLAPQLAMHDAFKYAPLSLKRSDIQRFLDAKPTQRAFTFVDYFPSLVPAQPTPWKRPHTNRPHVRSATLLGLEERIQELKQQRRVQAKELERLASLPQGAVPEELPAFEAFVNRRLYNGLNPKIAKERGLALKTTAPVRNAVTSLRTTLHKLRTLSARRNAEVLRLEREADLAVKYGPLGDALRRASATLTASFLAIANAQHIQSIEINVGRASVVAFEVAVVLSNGRRTSPAQSLSEANQDLVALLVFLALAKEAANLGQARVLILDDVLQSLSGGPRIRLMEWMLREFADWQLVITVHDRLWREQLSDLFRRLGVALVEREVRDWTFERGPIVDRAPITLENDLASSLSNGSIESICSLSGRLLEATAHRLSWVLEISVVRRRGDRYTLGDLWPGVRKFLKGGPFAPTVEDVDRWLVLRNLLAAHYNEWATSLTRAEAREFGSAVLTLAKAVRCAVCGRPLERSVVASRGLECVCGATKTRASAGGEASLPP